MQDDDFDKAFEGFGEDKPATPPADDTKQTPPKDDEPVTPTEESNKDEPKPEEDKNEKPADSAEDEESKEENPKTPETSETPPEPPKSPEPETPQPLTKDDVTSIIANMRNEERNSSKELDTTTEEVLKAYYPDGLSNILVDQASGKELRTPQDVVDVSNGEMSLEEASQWLMNEQFKVDRSVSQIKEDARKVAETTVNFRRDATASLQKYEPLFKQYPQLQQKVYDRLMKLVKKDDEKGVILSSPDVAEFYDDFLEPYQQAYEFSTKQSATNPAPKPPEPKPGIDDRLDESGDGGATPPDDPNDFAQQVKKELAKGL